MRSLPAVSKAGSVVAGTAWRPYCRRPLPDYAAEARIPVVIEAVDDRKGVALLCPEKLWPPA